MIQGLPMWSSFYILVLSLYQPISFSLPQTLLYDDHMMTTYNITESYYVTHSRNKW